MQATFIREIKFRAYSNYSKKTNNEYKMYEVQSLWFTSGSCEIDDDIVGFDKVILMRYTGLKDKNGKEIYEGDILRFHSGGYEQKGVVEWHEHAFLDKGRFRSLAFTL